MSKRQYTNWTLAKARPLMHSFLERMRTSGNVRLSCNAADIPRSTAYYWRGKFKTFSEEWDEAKADAVDVLDAEAWKRAVDGQSDRLLMFLLQAHRPEVYKPVQKIKHSGTGKEGAIEIKQVGLTDAERRAAIRAMLGDGRLSETAG